MSLRGAAFVLLVALIVLSAASGASASQMSWLAPTRVDASHPFGHVTPIPGVACPSVSLCVAVDQNGDVLTSRDPAGSGAGWTTTRVDPGNPLDGIVCPSVSLCVAYDRLGNVVTSTAPTSGAWTLAHVDSSTWSGGFPAPLIALSCPSASLCVGITGGGTLYASTNPAGGAGAWSPITADPGENLLGIACPSVSLCVALDNQGNLVISADPGDAGSWSVSNLFHADSQGLFAAVSCPSASLCVAVDQTGDFAKSANPAGGAAAWQVIHTHIFGATNLVCPSATLCLAPLFVRHGGLAVSTDPTGGAWSVEHPDPGVTETLACPSATLCLGFDDSGSVSGSTDPAAGTGTWTTPVVIAPPLCPPSLCRYGDQSVACPSATLCVIADDFGHLYSSTDPTDGHSWRRMVEEAANSLSSLSCAARALCVGTDDAGRLLTSTDPTGARPRWQVSRRNFTGSGVYGIAGIVGTGGVTCATRTLCLAWDNEPFAPAPAMAISTNPADGSRTWKRAEVFSRRMITKNSAPAIRGIACPSVALCVAATSTGIMTSSEPANRHQPWRQFPGVANVTTIACPSISLCLLGDDAGDVITVHDPADPASQYSWRRVHVDTAVLDTFFGLTELSCPTTHLCLALDGLGNVFTSTDPTRGWRAWHRAYVPYAPPGWPSARAIACASAALCMISDGVGNVFTSTHPAAGANSWKPTLVDPGSFVTTLSCPSRSTCIAGDDDGNVLIGRARS